MEYLMSRRGKVADCVLYTNLKSIFEFPRSLYYDSWLSCVGVVTLNILCLCIVGTDRQTDRPSGQEAQRHLSTTSNSCCKSVAPSLFTTHPAASHTLPALYMSSCSCNTPLRFPPVPFTFHNPSQCPKCR